MQVRRFRCVTAECPQRTFAEPLPAEVARRSAQRTARLDGLVQHLGIALGGRPGAGLAARLMLPVSRDTLLRVVRRLAPGKAGSVRVVGIDEWAWRRRQRYGTVLCDLERRCIVDLLPDRDQATVTAWLRAHPEVEVVARDRAGGFAGAVRAAAPKAIQVADRWHLMENASAAFLDVVRADLGAIRRALDSGSVNPDLLSAAERVQYESYLQRREANDVVRAMAAAGTPIKEIVRRTGRSRKLVRAVLRHAEDEVFRSRASSLEPWLPRLKALWDGGCRNAAELWRRLRDEGFGGCLRIVTEWATRRRRSEAPDGGATGSVPPTRTIARAMLAARESLPRAEAVMVAAIEAAVPALVTARDLIERFHRMLRSGTSAALPSWITEARASPVASFGRGIADDQAAVRAAMTEAWSNGVTEGSITKLKMLRRQMYGRGKLDLLRARLVAPIAAT
ncbi:transposase [Paracraurococcus ruber]|uniref:Transposase n=1 Tax=Paracraurococcus ruber TaxID=77675 RepID=A0ABS1CYT0_9PROT|nr:transposase [Paracraurococcus ruber]